MRQGSGKAEEDQEFGMKKEVHRLKFLKSCLILLGRRDHTGNLSD